MNRLVYLLLVVLLLIACTVIISSGDVKIDTEGKIEIEEPD